MERFAGRYGLLKKLGRGGMGEVFLAVDLDSGAEVALKRLTAAASGHGTLRAEFEALARVQHPSVVRVVELGFDFEGTPFLVMDYVPGWPADQVVRPGDWNALAAVAARVAGGLEALHAAGVAHGDLKPANVLVGAPGADGLPSDVRLVDFGLAALAGSGAEGSRGTPGFTAPEVVAGGPADAPADLYAFGATLFALAGGRPPFEAPDPTAVLARQRAGPPSALPLEEAGVPAGWVRLILQCLAPSPAERPRGATEIRKTLEALAPQARRPLSERLATQVLIGREREIARIERAWRRAEEGTRTVLVTGESGIGKSALLDAFAFRGALAGRCVIRVSVASAAEPAAAWRAIARRTASEARVDWRELPAAARAALEDHAPEPGEAALAEVSGRMAEWIRAIAARSGAPCVLLDDADALDPASLRALRRSMLGGASASVLWVLARRLDRGPLPDEERLLVGAGAWERLPLEPLDRDSIARFAASRLAAEPPAELVEFLWHRAAGHAGLTVEAMRAAADAGALRDGALGVEADAAALSALPMLADFEATRLGRLNGLSEAARAGARLLAARGVPLDAAALRRIEPRLTEDALEALRDQGLAGRDDQGAWSLLPPALGARVIEETPPAALREIHSAILAAGSLTPRETFVHRRGVGDRTGALEAAEAAFAASPDPALAAEAAALAAPGDRAAEASWLDRAARLWMDQGRYSKAAPLLERALESGADPAGRSDRWGRLTTCLLRNGDLAGVERAAAEARREPLTDAAIALVRTNEAARLLALGRTEDALAAARDAVDIARRAGDHRALGAATQTEGACLSLLGRNREAQLCAERAAEDYRRAGDDRGALRTECFRASLIWKTGKPRDAASLFRTTLDAARSTHSRLVIEESSTLLSGVLVTLGSWREARDFQSQALRCALEDGRAYHSALAMGNLAQLDGLMGSLREARIELRRAVRLARAHSPRDLGLLHRVAATILAAGGALSEARQRAERAVMVVRRSSPEDQLDWCLFELGRVNARLHNWHSVAPPTETRLASGRRSGSVEDVALASLAGRAALRLGKADRALELLGTIESWPVSASGAYAGALALQLRAEIALFRPGYGPGPEFADRALEAFASLPAVPDRCAAALEFARIAAQNRSADAEILERWLDEALAGFERLGDRAGREQALAIGMKWYRDSRDASAGPGRNRDLLEVVGRLIESLSDSNELVQRAMRLAVEQFDAERGLLLLLDPASGELDIRAEHGITDPTSRREAATFSRKVVERVTQSGDSLLIEDAKTSPTGASPSMLDLGLQSILCVPMFRAGKVLGAVYLDNTRRRGAFHDADRKQLEGFAQLMAIAIEKSRGAEEVRRANEELVGENLSLRQEVESRFHPSGIVGTSSAMLRVLAVVERAAQVPATVLLTGENGTGKERLARVLHHSGPRRNGPFVPVNCGAIPETLLESELFGILPKVASDVHGRDGRFVEANRGTLFLDEIGEMPLKAQVALLSVLSNREVIPVGGGKPIPVDVRVIAATNKDLRRGIEEGKFREDLFYRLNVIPIEVPALRERKADIPALARHFVEHFSRLQERDVPEMSPEFLAALVQNDWPGNVRELQNYVERVMAMTPGKILQPFRASGEAEERSPRAQALGKRRLGDLLAEVERRAIAEAMERARGNQSLAARELGLTEQTLRYRLKKQGVAGSRKISRLRNNRRKPRTP